MNCEQTRKAMSGNPRGVSRAERASVIRHWQDCQDCQKWSSNYEKEVQQGLEDCIRKSGGDEKEIERVESLCDRIATIEVKHLMAEDCQDPEYLAVRLKK